MNPPVTSVLDRRPPATSATPAPRPSTVRGARQVVGGFFLVMGGVHLGLVAADPEIYRHFADRALFDVVVDGWREIVMTRPELYGLLLMTGEVVLGTALLVGGRAACLGWVGVITFHVLLLVFGWGLWAWSVPVLCLLVPLAVRDVRGGCRR